MQPFPRPTDVSNGLAQAAGSLADVSDAWPTWREWVEALTLRAGFNTTTVIVGATLLGLAAGVIGVFTLLRKRSLESDALSHATLPGIAIAHLAALAAGLDARSLPLLLVGASATAILGALTIQAIVRHSRLREDAAIGIVLSVFFGAGIVLLSYIQRNAPEEAAGLGRFIYGQTAALGVRDAGLMGAIAVGAIVVTLVLRKELATVAFDDSFAAVQGWPVPRVDLALMALVIAVTVSGLQAVGLLLVVALLILPAVAARFWTERLGTLVVLAGVFGALSGYSGAVVSSLLPRKPAGAVIVLTAGTLFGVGLVLAPRRGVLAAAIRRGRNRLRITQEHLLEAAYERELSQGVGTTLQRTALDRLARFRGWSAPTRWLVLVTLRRRGKIEREVGGVRLTDRGRAHGARVSRNHRLWEQYLISYADIAPNHVDWSVDVVEHILSGELVRELEAALARRGVAVPRPPGPAAGCAG